VLSCRACSRRSDIANERLPKYTLSRAPTIPVPSMRRAEMDMDTLIRMTLEEEDQDSVVERLADRIARGRRVTGKPRPLKRFDTA
jgi:serine/threonine-protein phosphatase 2B catalytic subunit